MNKKVYVLNCDYPFDFREAEFNEDYEAIMDEAKKRDSVYTLDEFQEEMNWETLSLENSFILIR